jgi:hypothetical protein
MISSKLLANIALNNPAKEKRQEVSKRKRTI